MEQKYTREKLLTTPAELQKKLGSSVLCLIDTRPAEDYAQGHIPGATHFDLFGLSLVDTTDAPLKAFMFMIHHVLELPHGSIHRDEEPESHRRRVPDEEPDVRLFLGPARDSLAVGVACRRRRATGENSR